MFDPYFDTSLTYHQRKQAAAVSIQLHTALLLHNLPGTQFLLSFLAPHLHILAESKQHQLWCLTQIYLILKYGEDVKLLKVHTTSDDKGLPRPLEIVVSVVLS